LPSAASFLTSVRPLSLCPLPDTAALRILSRKEVRLLNVASTESVLRALYGYFFLVFIVRIVGRRPGKQLTPFEFILIFFLGGMMLTAIVSDEASVTNAFCQIIAVAFAHWCLAWARTRSDRVAKILDGTPLILLEDNQWRSRAMRWMRIQDDDVMEKARDQGLRRLDQIESAVLERNGEISILAKED
jgi:uncharacterized membrane protein YcaP (DUF421 family)